MKVFETERLVLRQMNMDDVENLLGIFSDPEAMRFYPGTKDEKETREWITRVMNSYEKNGFGLWIALFKDTLEFAGQCGFILQEVEGQKEVEIGYLFLRKYWNRGLATEAAVGCRNYGFNKLGYKRLISLIDPGNLPSRRVAEKGGMKLEKEVIKWDKPILVYSIESER